MTRRINLLYPYLENGKVHSLRKAIIQLIEERHSDQKYIMPRNTYLEYDAAFQESNEWVRANYFPARETLFPPTPIPAETRVYLSEGEIQNLVNAFIAECQNKLLVS